MDDKTYNELRQGTKLKKIAKEFKNSIPAMMAIPLPDSVIDGLNDVELPKLLEILKDMGLQQLETAGSYGHWERI